MKIEFIKVRWKNFFSTGNYFNEIALNTPGITLITGVNGSGKSTMIDAIAFALYGCGYRNVNKNQLINGDNNKDSLVELEFKVNGVSYVVRRGQKPTIFEVFENGKLLPQEPDAREQQRKFENDIIKMSFLAFKQIIVLSPTNFKPFFDLTAAERRSIVESLIQLQVIGSMNVMAKQKRNALQEKFNENRVKLVAAKQTLSGLQELARLTQQSVDEVVSTKRVALQAAEERLAAAETALAAQSGEYERLLEKQRQLPPIETIRKSIQKATEMLGGLDMKISEAAKQAMFFEQHEQCPVCSQNIPDTLKQQASDILNSKQQSAAPLKATVNKVLEDSKEIQRQHTELTQQINDQRRAVDREKQNANLHRNIIERLNAEIDDIQKTSTQYDNTLLTSTQASVDSLNQEREAIEEQIAYHNTMVKLLDDDGIKADVVRHYIPIINASIEYYLNLLDYPVGFKLTESFEGNVTSPTRKLFSYTSFSEGEKKRIDLALLFAWREVAIHRNSINTNLLIFDEVLDGSLDSVGIDFMLDMFATTDSNIIMISHKESIIDKVPVHIRVEKKGQFSRVYQ